MPRDGSGVFSPPAGTAAGPAGTPISSAAFNTLVADITADMNAARPVVAGGTGGTSPASARAALGAQASSGNLNILSGLSSVANISTLAGLSSVTRLSNLVNAETVAGGVFGWGNALSNIDIGNLDDIAKPAGVYRYGSTTTGVRPAAIGSTLSGQLLHMVQSSALLAQILWTAGADTLYYRRYNAGAWTAWRTVLDDGNFRTLMPIALQPSVATTTGAQFDFTAIPSWANEIEIQIHALTHTGTGVLLVQAGTSAGLMTSGYTSGSATIDNTSVASTGSSSGVIAWAGTGDTASGKIEFTRLSGNVWTASHSIARGLASGAISSGAGGFTLPGTLDRLRLLLSASGAFTGGSASISYK